MAKKKAAARKPSGAAGLETIDGIPEEENGAMLDDVAIETEVSNGHPESIGRKANRPKKKAEPQSNGNFGAADIRKAAAFANAIGGLDKAISLLQLLKIAKEVQ
jgi:hypothetical protein